MDQQGMFGERYEARIARAIAHVEADPAAPAPLDRLAGIACLSPYHFHRIFRALTGETVRDFVERRRLEHGLWVARRGGSWKAAARDSGFASADSFARAFRRVFGTAPSAFDLADWAARRRDRDAALSISDHFLRPPPPLDPGFMVTLEERPAARLAVARAWGGYLHPERLIAAYGRLRDWAAREGIPATGGVLSGASRDDPDLTPLSRCRYDFQLELPDGVMPPPRFALVERPAGHWASVRVTGDLAVVDRTWAMLFKTWLPASGLDLRAAPAEEFYLRLPEEIGWDRFDLVCRVPVLLPEGEIC